IDDIVIPDPNDAVAEGCEVRVANSIGGVIGMLSAIDLDDQPLLAADEIDVITSDRLLASELEPAKPAIAQLQPKYPFRARAAAAQRTGAVGRSGVWTAYHRSPLTPALSRVRGEGDLASLS